MNEQLSRPKGVPRWKVYNPQKEYVAACHYLEDAAAIVASYGRGAQIRWLHRNVVYQDGIDGSAAESYDQCAATARQAFLAQKEAGELKY